MAGIFASCQGPELLEQIPEKGSGSGCGNGMSGKVPIVFSASVPKLEPTTKGMNHDPEIHSFHLIVFDKEGMLVETAEAEMIDSTFTNEHGQDYHRKFKVTLTLSDKERIIHFIANCPIDQIEYGHEVDVIGNLFVENGEGAYWSRAEVPHIQTLDKTFDSEEGHEHFHACEHLSEHLKHIHLLRNFAEIEVVDETGDDDPFILQGFTVYNTINKGTVAPYNDNTQSFQCFVDEAKTLESGMETIHDYDDLMAIPYEGHALTSAELNSKPPKDANGDYIWYGQNFSDLSLSHENFFMYERKVSVRTADEDKWRESPPHVIVKALYRNDDTGRWDTCYYKFDLVYNIMEEGPDGEDVVSEIKYFNILRNFLYHFTIKDVDGPGYDSPEAAIAGITSNNIAGSTTASGFKEVTIATDRITVSFTDTTIVNSGVIHFKYKYEPNFADENIGIHNELVSFVDAIGGDVIDSYAVSESDIVEGNWTGYRDVAITIKEPTDETKEQVITVKPQNVHLSRGIRFILRKRLDFLLECKPRIYSGVNVPQTVDIKLPPGLTADMFPLELAIEVKGLTLSPDADSNKISLPVHAAKSIVPEKQGQNSFYFTYTINTYSDYVSIPQDADNLRTLTTHWRTNIVNNASTVYVANKYFNTAYDSWTNANNEFTNVQVDTENISKGLDRDVSISFVMDADDASSTQRDITIRLDGLRNPTAAVDDDESVMTIRATTSGNVVVTGNGNAKTVTVSGLKTTDPEGKVGFTLDTPEYILANAESGDRIINSFNGRFDKEEVDANEGIPVNYMFDVPTYFAGMVINVTIDGLAPAPASDESLKWVESVGAINKYSFKPGNTGSYTLKLQTVNKQPSICSISLETNNEYYYTPVTSTLNQAMKMFDGLTVSDVRQGIGRPVTVQFDMANDDADYANKDIRVALVGMRRSSDGATTFTVNTGDANAVDINITYRTVTLKNIVTSTVSDDLSVTIAADDYLPSTVTRTDRQPGSFTNVVLNPTSVGAEDDLPVTLTFNLSVDDYYDGMTVNVELDGLLPADGSLEPATRATTQYAYSPSQSGQQTIALKTAADGERTCTVKLSAAGFKDSETLSVSNLRVILLR